MFLLEMISNMFSFRLAYGFVLKPVLISFHVANGAILTWQKRLTGNV